MKSQCLKFAKELRSMTVSKSWQSFSLQKMIPTYFVWINFHKSFNGELKISNLCRFAPYLALVDLLSLFVKECSNKALRILTACLVKLFRDVLSRS